MGQIIKHFTDTDLYKLNMCCAIIDNFPRAVVRYQFVDRDNTVYPKGFSDAVNEQIKMLETLHITEEEINFMKEKCKYIPHWFYTYLKGFRYNSNLVQCSQDNEGHLHITFEGNWSETVLLEVQVLAIVSELYYKMTNQDIAFDYDKYFDISYDRANTLLNNGCVVSDFGTRRRSSFETQETMVKAFTECYRSRNWEQLTHGKFVGTSNVYLAMKYNLSCIGTIAHEFICGVSGIYGGPTMANHIAMEAWRKTFRGSLGIWLYDTFGFDIFSLNFSEDFANLFRGLRIDSGDNFEQLKKIVEKYKSLGIDSKSKQVVFSNALDVQSAINIQKVAKNVCQPSFGIGTKLSNNWEGIADIKSMNIVIKLLAIKITESWNFFNDTCKLSEDKGKHTGDIEVVKRYMSMLPQYKEELKNF